MNVTWFWALALALMLLLHAACMSVPSGLVAAAETIYVAPGGNDAAEGTLARPLKTLKQALAKAVEGGTIELAAGRYAGNVKTIAAGVTIAGSAEAVLSSPGERGIEVRHARIVIRGLTIERCDIGIWLDGASDCLLEGLTLRDIGGEGIRIKNQSCRNVIRRCHFLRMGREGFDVAAGRKNGEAIYIGTAPEQRNKNQPPNVPDSSSDNIVEDCTFETEAAEAVDIKEDSEENVVRRCVGSGSRDPDGAVFGSRGDRNRFEHCIAKGGAGHGFRFGGDTIKQGQHGQTADRTYGAGNVMRHCRAEGNALWGVAPMVQPQNIDDTNVFVGNGRGAIRK